VRERVFECPGSPGLTDFTIRRTAMSVVRTVIFAFACDYPGCTTEPVELMPDRPFLQFAARELREREGWVTQGGKHYCPAHKPLRSAQ
jgi:hypothetical protein